MTGPPMSEARRMAANTQVRFTGGAWHNRTEWIHVPEGGVVTVYAPPHLQSYKLLRVQGQQVARYIPGSTRSARAWLKSR